MLVSALPLWNTLFPVVLIKRGNTGACSQFAVKNCSLFQFWKDFRGIAVFNVIEDKQVLLYAGLIVKIVGGSLFKKKRKAIGVKQDASEEKSFE